MNNICGSVMSKAVRLLAVCGCIIMTACMLSRVVNASNIKRTPVISIHGQTIYEVERGESIKLPKVTAKDRKDGNITKKIKIKLISSVLSRHQKKNIIKKIREKKRVVFSETGDYDVEYSVKNRAGKRAKKRIHITVKEPKNRDWILTQHTDETGSQGMFYTLYNEYKDCLVVVDGGNAGNAEYVRSVIDSYGGKVDFWILTHYHGDHIGAFNVIMSNPKGIEVDKIYASPVDYDEYMKVVKYWDTPEALTAFNELTKYRKVDYLNIGDEFTIDNLRVKVFNSYSPSLAEIGDIPNNASLMFKISGETDSVLFCGDCWAKKMGEQLIEKWGDELKAEYVQTGHHGNNSLPTTFYDVVSPQVAFFDAPEWLMVGENFTAKDLKKYFTDKNVKVYDMTTAPNEFVFK